MQTSCIFCQVTLCFEEELREKKINSENSKVENWFIVYCKENTNKVTLFTFKMEEKLVVKYYSSQYGKEPFKATEDAAGYDLFAAEA